MYIVSNNAHTLYTGATENLARRIDEHKNRLYPNGFTARYTFDRCVYFEVLKTSDEAYRRERQIKGWSRAKKIALIQKDNPNWLDLSVKWDELLRLR